MVHFITTQKDNMSVEAAMRSVNNYVEFKELDRVLNLGQHNLEKEDFDSLQKDMEYISRNCVVSVDVPIYSGGAFKRIKILLKKVLQKSIQWYIRDIAKQQAEINKCFVRCINQQTIMMTKMMIELEELRMLHTAEAENRILNDQDEY